MAFFQSALLFETTAALQTQPPQRRAISMSLVLERAVLPL
jgi:hypothetical protein